MLLCDAGNSSLHFYKEGKSEKIYIENFDIGSIEEEVYYINVNPQLQPLFENAPLWHDISMLIELPGSYESLGIDRKAAAAFIADGVVIDAGSAITVDVMKCGRYEGGFIYPGFDAMRKAYAGISSKLDYLLNFELSLDKMAKNSQDAITFGVLGPLVHELQRICQGQKVIATGGDGEFFLRHLPDAEYNPHLLFHAMQKILATKKGIEC